MTANRERTQGACRQHRQSHRVGAILILAWVASILCCSQQSWSYTPASPEVRRMVQNAIAFLTKEGPSDQRVGAQALVGLAILKSGASLDNPAFKAALKRVVHEARTVKLSKDQPLDIYSAGLSLIFLCEYDPATYHNEIERLIRYLEIVQKPHGGWGYSARETGDTSMTQYGVLGMWEALNAGFNVPPHILQRVAEWLIRTQDPSGAFGYQGRPSPVLGQLVKQEQTRISMTTAGLASLYVIADIIGLYTKPQRDDSLPPAIREVRRDVPAVDRRHLVVLPPELFVAAFARGNAWMQANYRIDSGNWQYYYLYALERYWSFRNAVERRPDTGGFWYDDGVEFLRRKQQANGSWNGNEQPVPATAFAVLFLVRSTKRSIQRVRSFGDGVLVGGRGLPKNTAAAMVVDGRVVSKTDLASLNKLLAALDDPANPDRAAVAQLLADLPVEQVQSLAATYGSKFEELIGAVDPHARLAAVRALARGGNLDAVPLLIYALSDPDPQIVREARDGLRRISRRFEGFGLPDNPNRFQIQEAIRKWREWYLSIKPDAKLD